MFIQLNGSVNDYTALENITIKKVGDVYNLLDTGANYVWTNNGWDKLSENFDLSNYVEIDVFNELLARVEALEGNSEENNGSEGGIETNV